MSDARPDVDLNVSATDSAAMQSCATGTDPAAAQIFNQQLIAEFRATRGELGGIADLYEAGGGPLIGRSQPRTQR